MVLDSIQTFWEDCSCTTTVVDHNKVAPICQKDGSCPVGWELFDGHCYQLVANTATWTEAEEDCNTKGGHLASIHSEDENTFIFKLWGSSSQYGLWIGGTDAALEVSFTRRPCIHNTLSIQRFP